MGSVSGKAEASSVNNHGDTTTHNNDNKNFSSFRSSVALYRRRRAHHAGSWYDVERSVLERTLDGFLNEAAKEEEEEEQDVGNGGRAPADSRSGSGAASSLDSVLRAVIVPHAGYSYSGPTAAHSYGAVRNELRRLGNRTTQILVLHPSHHVHLEGRCAVSGAVELETPLGNLKVDEGLRNEIHSLGSISGGSQNSKHKFTVMTQSQDENEHSGELQYPYLAHCLNQTGKREHITVTPVMCGSLSTSDEVICGRLLSAIIARPNVLTVISTDFCHWGRRFHYQPLSSQQQQQPSLPIHQFIEQLDRRGMDAIAAQQPGAFATYLKETNNTICGRHAVAVWLRAVEAAAETANVGPPPDDSLTATASANRRSHHDTTARLSVKFVKYAQSSQSKTLSDSSVSYAAAIATIDEPFLTTNNNP